MLLADWLSFLDIIPEWMQSWWFLGPGIAVLAGLITVYVIIRNQRPSDDD